MPEYTYEDIITAKDIITGKVKKEDIIGKKGWGFDVLTKLSEVLMRKPDKLNLIAESTSYPFFAGLSRNIYFLPKKIEKSEYEPFDFDDPEVRKELMGKTVHYKANGFEESEAIIFAFHLADGAWTTVLPAIGYLNSTKLFESCKFLDDTPCGKLKEDKR